MARPGKNTSLDETITKIFMPNGTSRKRERCLKRWKRAINLTKRSWSFYQQEWRDRNGAAAGRWKTIL